MEHMVDPPDTPKNQPLAIRVSLFPSFCQFFLVSFLARQECQTRIFNSYSVPPLASLPPYYSDFFKFH